MADRRIETSLIDSYSGLEALKPQWLSLLDRCQHRTLFSTWEWMDTIGEDYGSALKPFAIAVFQDGVLAGVAPLAIVEKWKILREVRFLGMGPFNYSIADYLDFIIADGMENTVVGAVVDELKRRSDCWDIVDLEEVRETSPLITLLLEEAAQNGLYAIEERSGSCYPVSLPDTWEEYLAMLTSKTRSTIRRKTSKFITEYSVRFERIDNEPRLASAMDTLVDLHTARWRREGLPGMFDLDGMKKFHMDLALKLLRKGWLDLVLMYANDQPVGASYNFRCDGLVYSYTYGYDPGSVWSRYSLGTILTSHAIKVAIEDGFRGFDLLRGHGDYKMRYGASRIGQFRLRLFKSRPHLYTYLGLRSLRATGRNARAYVRGHIAAISTRRAGVDEAGGD